MFAPFTILAAIALAVSPCLALISAVDSSSLVPQATYKKALSQGFTKALIRGYHEACSIGGEVDPAFVASYNNARAVGYTNIDTYWYPCTGAHNKCKPFPQQIAELGQAFQKNHMNIGRIWVDFEYDKACDNWNYGHSGNLAVARQIIAAIKASGYKWGIYSGPGEWQTVFGSHSVVLDNSVPLWFAKYDGVKSLHISIPFGGWSGDAAGHQYSNESASKKFDLSVFAS